MTRFSTILLIISLLLPATSQAVMLNDLFSARIPVTSQSAQQRVEAIPKALTRVLIKVSGNANVATLPAIKTKISNANGMVQQYSYIKQAKTDTDAAQQLFVKIDFEPQQIIALLHDARQAVWGKERPLLIAWVTINNGQQTYLLGNNDTQADQLENDANGRGLPLTVPMMDIRDMSAVSTNDINQANIDKLTAASQRYGQGNVLIGQIQMIDGQQWQAQWMLYINDQRFSWQVNGASVAQVMNEGVAAVADSLAARFAILENPDANNAVLLKVSQIDSASAYAAALRYLQKLAAVKDVEVVDVSAGQVTYKLQLLSSERALIQAIAINPKLKPANNESLMGNNYLQYRWAL